MCVSGLSLRYFPVAIVTAVFLATVWGSPVSAPDPIRCAPCTPEKLQECPAVAPDCEDVQREPGCGCCPVCALNRGDFCGVYTAHCGSGLRCIPRADDPRPLHSLTRGQAICTEAEQDEASPSPSDAEGTPDYSSVILMLRQNKPLDPRDTVDGQESVKAKVNAIRKKLVEHGPCHTELQGALEWIATAQNKLGDKFTTFYLPNCDKYGFYKAKQCETSLEGQQGICWCVSSWNGKRIPGSGDVLGDSECQEWQELTY